jgi:hypothetical protein
MSSQLDNQALSKETLTTWYYERLQGVSKSQARLLWSGLILGLAAALIILNPSAASKIEFLGIPLVSIATILPAVIFLVLAALQGSFTAAGDSLQKLKSHIGDTDEEKSLLRGVYDIDRHLNFLDYCAYMLDKQCWGRFANLLYPLYIALIFLTALPLVATQIAETLSKPTLGIAILSFINFALGCFCYIVSRPFFQGRWEKFKDKQPTKTTSVCPTPAGEEDKSNGHQPRP